MAISLRSPMSESDALALKAGDEVLLSGVIYTARDAAHARLCEALARGAALPVDLRGQTVYYAGPTPTPPDKAVGAIGPTTSARMDMFTPTLLQYGLRAMIGKGGRSEAVKDAMRAHGAVYLAAVGGCAALGAACVRSCEPVAYLDLGTESIKRLEVENLPLVVAVDASGGDAYAEGQRAYLAGQAARADAENFLNKYS